MNYKEFISLVPNDTKEFIDTVLPLLYYYKNENNELKFSVYGGGWQNYYTKALAVFLIAYASKAKYNALVSQYGFSNDFFSLSKYIDYDISLDEAFYFAQEFIPTYSRKNNYCKLTPTDIMINVINECYDKIDTYNFVQLLLPRVEDLTKFRTNLDLFNKKETQNIEELVEKETFNNLKIGVVNYLETAVKLFNIFDKNNITSDDNLVSLSLLYALFFYVDAPEEDNLISEKQAIIKKLNDKKIFYDTLQNNVNIYVDSSGVDREVANIYLLREKYNKFILELEKNIKREKITVSDIFLKALDKNFTNNLVIDKILAKMGVGIDSFNNFKEEIKNVFKEEAKLIEEFEIDNFYKDLSKDTIDFMEFTGKVYMLLLRQMQEREVNEKILATENDASVLALFIANCYYNLEVYEFFEENKVTLDKVLTLLNIKINKKNIEEVVLDKGLLVKTYTKYIKDGVNARNKKEDIDKNKIILNLTDREFTQSMILENIFEALCEDVNLNKDFTKQMKETLKIKKMHKENELREKLFHDLNIEVIDILQRASTYYNALDNKKGELEKQDKKAISLLLSVMYNDVNMRKFCCEKNIFLERILEVLDINYLSEQIYLDKVKDYGEYIFGGCNKDKERKRIDTLSIVKNIFDLELNNSVYYKMFLNDFKFLKGDFVLEYQKYLHEKMTEEYINNFYKASSFIKRTVNIYEELDNKMSKLINNEDKVVYSLLLAILKEDCKEKTFLEKSGLTYLAVLEKIGLNEIEYKNTINYNIFNEQFKKYFSNDDKNKSVSDIIKKILLDKKVLEQVDKLFKIDYKMLSQEIKTGISYEDSLTISDRIELLSNSKVTELNDEYSSVLNFGQDLLFHAKYINSELPKLVTSDIFDKSTKTIKELLDKVSFKEEKKEEKKSFLKRLFFLEINDDKKVKIGFNIDAIYELLERIDEQLKILTYEFRQYENMSNYIDAYRKRNKQLIEIATKKVVEVEEKLHSIDGDNEELFGDYLKLNTLYDALYDKTNRLNATNQIMRQNLISINQNMKMHLVTINTLKMARDDLIPLVVSQLTITKGQETEKESLELSENIFSLLQSLLSKNVEGAINNMNDLKKSMINPETIALIDADIKSFVDQLKLDKTKKLKLEV